MEKIDTALGVAIVAILMALLLPGPSVSNHAAPAPLERSQAAQAGKSEHEMLLMTWLLRQPVELSSGGRAASSYLRGLQLRKAPPGYLLLLPQAQATTDPAEFKRFIWSFWRAYKEAPIPTIHAIYLGNGDGQQVRTYRVVRVADIHAGFKAELSFDVLVEQLLAGIETVTAEDLEGTKSLPRPSQRLPA